MTDGMDSGLIEGYAIPIRPFRICIKAKIRLKLKRRHNRYEQCGLTEVAYALKDALAAKGTQKAFISAYRGTQSGAWLRRAYRSSISLVTSLKSRTRQGNSRIMDPNNRNVFSIERFAAETQGFQLNPGPKQRGMLISKLEYLVFLLLFRKPWRLLYRARLTDQCDQTKPLLYLAPSLQEGHVRNCRVFASRYAMLESFDKGRIWAEVGTFEGRFAAAILEHCRPAHLHVIDVDLTLARQQRHVEESSGVTFHEGSSHKVLAAFPDEYFDYIYIDAAHDLFNVARDAELAVKKIKPEGTIVFNDYILLSHVELSVFGVVPVVNALCNYNGWEMVAFAMHPKLYCDVALRRRIPQPEVPVH
jgi:hypothetical protein